ncbi:hypothetical protein [Wolbachia endosymbiont of Mansonella perstans]|uniref:hypothetical protein n=1 Tax=Wolbachia endosymbiont of Mansonella perstans TaxID=229526 RepID=UPI001CE06C71|nr:hypothetical protein [Wolbachia endosymbiont of Mansonella perstans]MCA4773847.1 hypothetical protein [Wolbachia endosymbiont of Mansonella perstans]
MHTAKTAFGITVMIFFGRADNLISFSLDFKKQSTNHEYRRNCIRRANGTIILTNKIMPIDRLILPVLW